MKNHLLTISLALVSATFLWGCQEQGSGPLGLRDPGIQAARKGPPPDKGGRPVPHELTLSGGMVADAQLVEAVDDTSPVHVSAGNINLQIDLQATEAAGLTACSTKGNAAKAPGLIEKLTDPLAPRDEFILNIFIKEQGEPTGSNIAVGWDGVFALRIDDAIVSLENGKYEFRPPGTVRIFDKTGKRKDHVTLTCPLQVGDEITVSLTLL